MTTNLEHDLQTSLARGGRLVGALCYWKHLDTFSISRTDFRTGMTAAGFADALVADPKPEAILHKAVAAARVAKLDTTRSYDFELREKTDHAIYALIRRWDTEDGAVRYLQDGAIAVKRDGSTEPTFDTMDLVRRISINDVELSESMTILRTAADAYSTLSERMTSREISSALVRAMSCLQAVAMRDGVFLVPGSQNARLEALGTFLAQAAPEVTWRAWKITDNGENLVQARKDARVAFRDQIQALVLKVGAFTDTVKPEEANPRSIMVYQREFKALSDTVDLWVDVLGDHRAELQATLDAARSKLLAAYLGGDID